VERVVIEVGEALPQVKVRYEGTFGDVEGDEGLLRQALLNLTRNASEACESAAHGGRVLVRGEVAGADETGLQQITVFDNGPGIEAPAMAKLFRPFFTTKANGTWLGLAVVRKIIGSGGAGAGTARPEGGAAFVTLPLPEGCQGSRIKEGQHLF
jgi:C4-dicarboxylate-specific signal transduction histidine kinase